MPSQASQQRMPTGARQPGRPNWTGKPRQQQLEWRWTNLKASIDEMVNSFLFVCEQFLNRNGRLILWADLSRSRGETSGRVRSNWNARGVSPPPLKLTLLAFMNRRTLVNKSSSVNGRHFKQRSLYPAPVYQLQTTFRLATATIHEFHHPLVYPSPANLATLRLNTRGSVTK